MDDMCDCGTVLDPPRLQVCGCRLLVPQQPLLLLFPCTFTLGGFIVWISVGISFLLFLMSESPLSCWLLPLSDPHCHALRGAHPAAH